MENNNLPKYVRNKPIGKDQFEGQAHDRIATSIAKHITEKNNSFKVLGIEGEWGSGKSNIIELLRKKLENTHHIYIYDTWGHQEDSQRRAFLEELTEELIEKNLLTDKTLYKDVTGNKLKITWGEKIKFLLSRKRETNKKTIPKVSGGIILIGLVIILTPIFALMSDFLGNDASATFLKIIFSLSLLIITFFSLLLYSIWKKFLSKHKVWPNLSSIFYLYKGNDLENTTYEIFSDLEPSVKEFKEWIESISTGLSKKDLVIVYDNMDRLPPEKVKEIWSSIHTFFAEKEYDKIDVIIPFDRVHLQKAFEDKAEQTSEFINKTFSIIYRVTPPVLTDWKDFFAKKFKEAFEESEENEFYMVLLVFDRLKNKFTPRDIIFFINDLVTYKKIWINEIPLRYIAIFSIKKENILKDPQKNILSNEYLETAKDLFAEDENLPNYISALTFNVPVEKASQVLLVRDLELTLRGEEVFTIEELSKHPHFIEILEEVIQNSDIVVDKAVPILSKLDIKQIKGTHIKARIEHVWNTLVTKQCLNTIEILSFEEKYKTLLLNSSKESRKTLVKYLVDGFYCFTEIKGTDYYNSFSELESFVSTEKINFKIESYLKNKNVSSETFLNYLSVAGSDYRKFNVKTDSDELDEHILEKLPDELDNLPTIINLSLIHKDYSFEDTIERIEELITDSKLTKDNFNNILLLYKSVSSEKPLKNIVTRKNLYNLLQNTTNQDDGYYDLISIRLKYGNTYTLSDTTVPILSEADENIVKEIAERIEYYGDYGDLLLMAISWPKLLLKAVCRDLAVNSYVTRGLNIKESLKQFEEIKDAIDIEADDLLKSFDDWTKFAKEEVNIENLEEVIPNYSFYDYSTSISLELTNFINKIAKDYINSIEEQTLIENWGDDDSYIYNMLYYFMKSNKIKSLPRNVFGAVKQMLIKISESKSSIPEEDSIWKYFIQQSNKSEITPTIKNIRDYFIRENNITNSLFIFFESLFRGFGELENKPADVARTILSRVVSNNSCFEIIVLNSDFYTSIINYAKADASDFKENIMSRLESEPDNEKLIEFASMIGVENKTKKIEDE